MLPAFHIRGFRDHEEREADVQLDRREDYDELIVEHPVATLGYVDDDDGEVITVCCPRPPFFVSFFADDVVGRIIDRTLRPHR
jgi:hypothetical protein